MIIPIRCTSCGKPIGHLWDAYKAGIKRGNPQNVLDKLGVERYCCRTFFITQVDLTKKIAVFKK